MKNHLIYLTLGIGFLTIVYLCGYRHGYMTGKDSVHCPDVGTPDTSTITNTDTKPIHDTAYIAKDSLVFVPVDRIIHDTLSDTIYLPREVREYRADNYFARVSGVAPSLDYIETYNTIIKQPITTTIKVKPKWSIGIQAGYGYSKGFSPYVGIGIQYNILTW